jgi:sodium pump decarboxylase gamma subunit
MEEGLVLLTIGMGTVFLFLALMVGVMQLSSKFFIKYAHLFPEAASKSSKPAAASAASADFAEIAVAIAAVKARTK